MNQIQQIHVFDFQNALLGLILRAFCVLVSDNPNPECPRLVNISKKMKVPEKNFKTFLKPIFILQIKSRCVKHRKKRSIYDFYFQNALFQLVLGSFLTSCV